MGGNSKTCLVLTCSPHSTNETETLNTLRFGQTAAKMINLPKVNKEDTIPELQAKVVLLNKDKIKLISRVRYLENQLQLITGTLPE